MITLPFIKLSEHLELAGLVWHPEIGDEIFDRASEENVSVLVDPQGMTPHELRQSFLWLPTVEQIIFQFEARQALLYHAGLELSESQMAYKTVVQSPAGPIESKAQSLRVSLGLALRQLLLSGKPGTVN